MSNEAEVPSLTTDDLCALLQVSRPVVQQLLRSEELTGVQTSRRAGWRVTPSAYDAWVRDQHTATQTWTRTNPSPAPGIWDRDTEGPIT